MNVGNGTHGHGAHAPGSIPHVLSQKWTFLAGIFVIFGLTFWYLSSIGFIPNSVATADDANVTPTATIQTSPLVTGPAAGLNNALAAAGHGEDPVKIVIPSLNKTATIANPDTTDVNTLDNYLLNGAVRYPTSATLGERGNVVLFGHSSYLPVVHNQAFKTFDGIQNLKKGDEILVYSSDRVYTYSVQSEQQESANSAAIPLTQTGYTLTLSTCDSFGQKTDRFVVTATLVGSNPLSS